MQLTIHKLSYDLKTAKTGGLYGFPRDAQGRVKIGYRGTKYTNPQLQPDGAIRSTPMTRWTATPISRLPQLAAATITRFVGQYLPELLTCQVKTRLCWYTDSFDNHFVVDFIPGLDGAMVATGGSGHGFHFLPTLGKYVVDRIEGKSDDNSILKSWRWRSLSSSSGEQPVNDLMQGYENERCLYKQVLTGEDSLSGGGKESHL